MATSLDIASLAGVSQSTVSRALRGDPVVNEKTRQRILEIARRLDYTVDKNASNLRSQHTHTLALLFFEDPTADDSNINPFFLSMQGSISRVCSERGYDLLVSFQRMSRNWHAEFTDSHKADGLILLGYGDFVAYRSKLVALIRSGTRFVRWGPVLPNDLGISVGSDNLQGGRLAAQHLVAQGRRRIAFIGTPAHSPEVMERYRGFTDALESAGIEFDTQLRVDAVTNEQSGRAAVRELLQRQRPFDAVFAVSDLIAIGAMQALAEAGLRVPDDVAVAGFDDIAMAANVTPPLTTIAQDTQQAGKLLVDTLIDLIEGKPAPSARLPTRLVMRRSSVVVPMALP